MLQDTKQTLGVNKCTCGLFYLNLPYDEFRTTKSYQIKGEYAYSLNGTPLVGRAQDPAFVYRKLLFPFYLSRVLGPLDGKRVFDLGSAEGIMVEGFRRFGCDAVGAEVDPGKLAYSKHIFGHENQELGSCDLLVCFHVLEHLVEVDRWLERMKDAVVSGGHIVLSVPRVFVTPNGSASDMGGDHLIGFDKQTLIGYVHEAGLEVLDLWADDHRDFERDRYLASPIWSGRRGDITLLAQRP